MKRVLFICRGNIHRSRTAETMYASNPGIEARSAGISEFARVQVTDELLDWADDIFVMDRRLLRWLQQRFSVALTGKEVVCLAVPDEYLFMQPELQKVLAEKLSPYLGTPTLDSASS